MQAYVWGRNLAADVVGRIVPDEAGEGVISTAIAVLIMAALGALMWVGFKAIWGNASSKTTSQINTIGS
jgi:TRAP-type C4-dicarboxylate transport system permease small subunit